MRSLFVILFLVQAPLLCFAETMEVHFSPNGGCQQVIVDEIDLARVRMDIAMYFLTSRDIVQALVRAKEHQVQVRVVFDKSQRIQSYSKAAYLIKRGFEVKYHTGEGLMHNKFAVIDDHILITGSFNWTPTAERNNEENLLIIKDAPIIAKYRERFEYLWGQAQAGEVKKEDGLRERLCLMFPGLCGD